MQQKKLKLKNGKSDEYFPQYLPLQCLILQVILLILKVNLDRLSDKKTYITLVNTASLNQDNSC